MLDILVYLFENYYHPEACPDSPTLARKLSAVGFPTDDIEQALEWLSGLSVPPVFQSQLRVSKSFRCFNVFEQAKLTPDSRGFITFLEYAGILDSCSREMILERAMAMEGQTVDLTQLKVAVLMVLWSQHQTPDALLLDELLEEERPVLH